MKKIGVVLRQYRGDTFNIYGANIYIIKTLRKFNVSVVGIFIENEIDTKLDTLKEDIKDCDGIIISGGDNPSKIDCELVKYLYDNNIPTLGICLGMQSMGRTFNGQIVKKIPYHNIKKDYVHKIKIEKNSLLYKILNKEKVNVNSRHEHALPDNVSYDPLKVVAKSEDGIIEAIEDQTKIFFLGVQWHPEALDDINSYKLFKYFINKL